MKNTIKRYKVATIQQRKEVVIIDTEDKVILNILDSKAAMKKFSE